MIRNLPPLCRFLLLAIAGSFLVGLILPKVTYLLPLDKLLVVPEFQVWRLATWPFFSPQLFPTITALVLIYFFGVELETIVHTKKLASALGVSVVVGGVLFIFVSPLGIFAGPEFIYIFILTGFTYLWPKREISVFGMFFVRTWVITLVIFLLEIIPLNGLQLDLSASKLFPTFFAAISALIFFHISYKQYAFGSAMLTTIEDLMPWRSKRVRGRDATWDDRLTIEHRIDAILDKISRKGMESLTKEEREFLFKHSSK